jgi:hypothetical protein
MEYYRLPTYILDYKNNREKGHGKTQKAGESQLSQNRTEGLCCDVDEYKETGDTMRDI